MIRRWICHENYILKEFLFVETENKILERNGGTVKSRFSLPWLVVASCRLSQNRLSIMSIRKWRISIYRIVAPRKCRRFFQDAGIDRF